MARPRILKIQGRRVHLVFKTDLAEPSLGDKTFAGLCFFKANRIEVESRLAPDEMRATAVHEVVHDIESQLGMKLTEREVCGLGSVLFTFIRDNPAFIAWVQEKK